MLVSTSVSRSLFPWKNLGKNKNVISSCSTQGHSSSSLLDKLNVDVNEEELEAKRFQARLPEKVYRHFIKKEFSPPVNKEHFNKQHLRRMYGKYGEASGLNPGLAWPTRDELLEIIEHDKLFHPPLLEMLDKVNAEQQEKERQQLEYEAQVERNMEKLESYKKEYYAKIEKKEKEEADRKMKQQQLIEEISELLGYDVDPKDPRFQEAVEMKKKEEKKQKSVKKQQESYERMMAKLASLAAASKKVEAASQSQAAAEENIPKVEQSENSK